MQETATVQCSAYYALCACLPVGSISKNEDDSFPRPTTAHKTSMYVSLWSSKNDCGK